MPQHVLAVHDPAGLYVTHFDGATWVVVGNAQRDAPFSAVLACVPLWAYAYTLSPQKVAVDPAQAQCGITSAH